MDLTLHDRREFLNLLESGGKFLLRPALAFVSRKRMDASAVLISGCQDNQTSADGDRNGLFTETLLAVWKNGKFKGDYRGFHESIVKLMPPTQSPKLFTVGRTNEQFENQKPFTV